MTALEWLPVGIGSAAVLLGLLGLASVLVPSLRTKRPAWVADGALYLVAGTLLLLPVFGSLRERTATSSAPVEIGLTSDPAGAEVYLNGAFAGYTPVTFQRLKGTSVH